MSSAVPFSSRSYAGAAGGAAAAAAGAAADWMAPVIAGITTPWFVPVLVLGVISTAIAYTFGINGVARLRPGFASLVALSEVLFAVLWAWLLIGEGMAPMQVLGGAVVLAGLALARERDRPIEAIPDQCAELTAARPHA